MAARQLPARQRRLAISLGTAGAVGLRIALTVVAAWLLSIPLLEAAGGLILVWIACKLLQEGESNGPDHKQGESLWEAIQIMVLADAIMSFDNILGVAAASHGSMPLLIFGLLLSMPIVIFVGTLLANLMDRNPWLARVGAGILAWTAGQMVLEDRFIGPQLPHTWALQIGLPLLMVAVVAGVTLASLRTSRTRTLEVGTNAST
jgi:YjbE family integral membrane protein